MAQAREQDRSTASRNGRSHKRIAVHAQAAKAQPSAPTSDIAEVRVSEKRFKRLAARRQHLRKLLANYADTAGRAERTGLPETVSLRVLPSGEIVIVTPAELDAMDRPAIVTPPAAMSEGDALDRALAAAKARGEAKAAAILKGDDMLTARAFCELIDVSHETVNAMRKRSEVLGLEAARRGVRYPRWQVTEEGLPLPGLARLFAVLGGRPWTVYRFLRTAHGELGGHTALEALKKGRVEAVLGAAENQVAGNFS